MRPPFPTVQTTRPERSANMTKLLSIFGISLLAVLLLPVTACHRAAEDSGKRFYVQLVRGNDQESPPAPGARVVGPRVSERLQSVLRWKHYWELQRDSVVVPCGHCVRKRISLEREVEIERPRPPSETIAVRVYVDGRLSQSRTQPVDGTFFITGGDKGRDQSWFIVVRDDPPPDPLPN